LSFTRNKLSFIKINFDHSASIQASTNTESFCWLLKNHLLNQVFTQLTHTVTQSLAHCNVYCSVYSKLV